MSATEGTQARPPTAAGHGAWPCGRVCSPRHPGERCSGVPVLADGCHGRGSGSGRPPRITCVSSLPSPLLPAMALPGVSFSPGLRIQDEIRASLGSPVSSSLSLIPSPLWPPLAAASSSSRNFGLILQATIGGDASLFKVSSLSDRVFRFMVATKEAGLFVHRLGSFECDLYKVFFHLWGHGGPNWRREFKLFLEEERES